MSSEYEQLKDKSEILNNLGSAQGVLSWDQEVMMPEKGITARAQQMKTLTKIRHELLTEDELGELILQLEDQDLTQEQAAVVREIREEHEKAAKVPNELMQQISEASSNSVEAWREAKKDDDFEKFRPHLEKMVELKRKYANHIDPEKEPYQVLFSDYEPFIRFETVEDVLDELEEELTRLIDDVRESGVELPSVLKGEFDKGPQEDANHELVDLLGFDRDRGRLDVSTHPFTSGNQFDTRITTQYDEDDLANSILATIHEFGHALYQLGLPQEHYGTPLGESRDLSIHESQSRLWENHVGRSEAFWEFYAPKLKEHFPQLEGVDSEDFYMAVNKVHEDNLIRIHADEMTYHLHIILRFRLGRQLVNGDLEVEELPEAWKDMMEELLGVRPETDAEGVLQDIHWSWGEFGYFPTYTMGSVLAAQVFNAAENDIEGLEDKIRNGEFNELQDWLKQNVHRHGCLYRTEKLVEKATGEKPTPEYFLDYIREKYSDLYDL